MKRMLSLLLAVSILLSLGACTIEPANPSTGDPTHTTGSQPTESTPAGSQPVDPTVTDPTMTDPKPTDSKPTDPKPTDPKPTDPKPTDPEPTDPTPEEIVLVIEAESPVRKTVDTQNRTDQNGNPMDHTYRAGLLGSDGLHYVDSTKKAIVFAAFDSYTYSFKAEKAGQYVLYIVGSCDRDSPIQYNINGTKGEGHFVRNDYQGYDKVELAVVNLVAGYNTLTVSITENKNHNLRTDQYILVYGSESKPNADTDWNAIIDAAAEAEKIKTPTENPVWMELYVSPDGKDSNDGSKNAPFATIPGANEAVKKLRNEMQGDIVIHVASGYYPISEPIVITLEGAGANGYRVIYRGDGEDKPIISGGVQITGWKKDGNIWSAPCDVEDTRTLYVNDNMAVRARSELLFTGSQSYIDNTTEYRSDGLIVKSRKVPKIANAEGVELVFDSEWMHHRYPVAEIIYRTSLDVYFVMEQPYWHALFGINGNNGNAPNVGKGFYIENAMELLDQPGEFYFDKENKRIYYYPFAEEDMTTAQCYVGVCETMLHIQGTNKNNRVDGLTFENIQFKYGAWNDVSNTGLFSSQADSIRQTTNPTTIIQIPGQVQVKYAQNITFRGCVFACLGSSAIAMPDAVSDCVIDGNVFKDISGVAISVGSSKHGTQMDSAMARPVGIDITNNVIRRIGAEFRSCPAVIVYYVGNTRIMHNDIAEVPYTGISLGWGWGQDVKECKDNIIAYNKIVDVASPTHDGAHIYILSPNYNTYINNNWCVDSGDMRGGVYPDEGAAHLNIFHNVIEDVHTYWLFARAGVYLRNIKAFQNYTDTDQVTIDKNHVTLADNVVVKNDNWPKEARDIMNAAGVMQEYKSLLDGVELPAWHTNFVKVIPNQY